MCWPRRKRLGILDSNQTLNKVLNYMRVVIKNKWRDRAENGNVLLSLLTKHLFSSCILSFGNWNHILPLRYQRKKACAHARTHTHTHTQTHTLKVFTTQASDQLKQTSSFGTWPGARMSNQWWLGCCVTLGLQTGGLTQSVCSPRLKRGVVALPVVRKWSGHTEFGRSKDGKKA